MKEKFIVTGMTCSACQNAVEKSVGSVKGVESVSVNLLTGDMLVEGQGDLRQEVVRAVQAAGYGVKDPAGQGAPAKEDPAEDLKTFFLSSLIFLIPLFYIAMGPMMGLPTFSFFQGMQNSLILALSQCLLTLPILILNRRYFISGFKALVHRRPTMDSLVAVGSGAAFLYGLFVIYQLAYGFSYQDMARIDRYHHDLYFESAGMILTLITMGKWLEARAKSKTTGAIDQLMDLTPDLATVRREGVEETIPLDQVRLGDLVLIKPGQSIPVDGVIVKGQTTVDQSSLTGESLPVDKGVQDQVLAATINLESYIEVQVDRVGEETTINKIIALVKDANASKAPIAKLADEISAIFVPAVMAISLLTFFVWIFLGYGLEFALGKMIAVLVISCPCALGLATPVAIMVGTGMGAKKGILFKNAEALEELHKVKGVFLDKTGTITQGQPQVVDWIDYGGLDGEKERIALLEGQSEHPLAKALVDYLPEVQGEKEDFDFQNILGQGLVGDFASGRLLLGNKKLMDAFSIEVQDLKDLEGLSREGKTLLYVAKEGKFLGAVALADQIKEGSKEAIDQLRARGLKTVMLTGDHALTAQAIAKDLALDEIVAGIFPDQKEGQVRQGQKLGKVAMVGDGINDAPALARAEVGVAIGAGTDIAIDSADVVLMHSDLGDFVYAWDLSAATVKNIKENLFWAFFYNVIGIPIAAGVFYRAFSLSLSPMIAAFAMSMSSLFVVTNALRLNAFKSKTLPVDQESRPASLVQEGHDEKIEKIERKDSMNQIVLKVEGMACGHCKKRVEEALGALEGVKGEVSLEEKQVTISYPDEVSVKDLKDAIQEAGYEVVS